LAQIAEAINLARRLRAQKARRDERQRSPQDRRPGLPSVHCALPPWAPRWWSRATVIDADLQSTSSPARDHRKPRVEFPSVVAAVDCALAIQEGTAGAESTHGDGAPIAYRIGINLGDVIVDENDMYGVGVNVAARVQTLAPVGGVAVSATVRDHVAGKVPYTFEDMGEHVVKNLERPVRVFVLRPSARAPVAERKGEAEHRVAICVLPFANMSGDPEQEYFSDGISEDIITDLAKVSALWVAARNTAFTFKGRHVDVPQVARQLNVSHVLEGSVRKAGTRVRITAQLIDGATGGHVWAERYDRDLNDIFALQDEISQAVVNALKLKLLPEEKKAIEHRGTSSPEAYKLYLMARQLNITGNMGDVRRSESMLRLCQRAIEIDPDYALPWAMMAAAQGSLRFHHGRENDGGLAAAERAIALDAHLAEAHAVRSRVLQESGRDDEARRELEIALALDPESYEVNRGAAARHYTTRRFGEAIPYYEKACTLMENDYMSAGMVIGCYKALGDTDGARRAARRALDRVERVLAQVPGNGSAMSFGVGALAVLGDTDRAKELMERALLLDADNVNMRYNFACALINELHDHQAALGLLEPMFAKIRPEPLRWLRSDPDLDAIRDHPRFKAMLAAAEARLASSSSA
jgi:adenylate cyclase